MSRSYAGKPGGQMESLSGAKSDCSTRIVGGPGVSESKTIAPSDHLGGREVGIGYFAYCRLLRGVSFITQMKAKAPR